MLKAEQIPDEVAQALIATLHGKPGLPYREAIAAAINAWPGSSVRTHGYDGYLSTRIILPLPKEPEA
jgi:hypothetical protein